MVKKANHCVYDTHNHVVMVMKYRKKILIKDEYIDYLCHLINELAERNDFEIEEIGTDGDHVHVLLSAPPRYSPAKLKKVLKGTTGKLMFARFPQLRELLWGGELWSDGGYVATIGQYQGMPGIVKYLRNQGKKKGKQMSLSEF
jgi:putative transposase